MQNYQKMFNIVDRKWKIRYNKREAVKLIKGKKIFMKNVQEILSKCDHTLLVQTATWEQIKKICDEGMQYKTASVCIPPC